MFTGIVQGKGEVVGLVRKAGLLSITLRLPEGARGGVEMGASIAVDGVCLTVTSHDDAAGLASFDIMQQTLDLTSLSSLEKGAIVNVERSAKAFAEIGGHCVSGHIDGVAEVVGREVAENNLRLSYRFPSALAKYLFPKGFVALNGCSLTIAAIDPLASTLMVCFIPETLRATTHGEKREGDRVNLEVDRQTQAIVDTVERVLAARSHA
jgi:riboflavin synthase